MSIHIDKVADRLSVLACKGRGRGGPDFCACSWLLAKSAWIHCTIGTLREVSTYYK